MEEKNINQLLERYWQCETTPEEELTLKTFFSGESIPEQWKIYQPLFAWENKQAEVKAGKQLKTRIQQPVTIQFYPLLKIAATVLLMLSAGIGFYTRYEQEKTLEKSFSETYTDPEDAIRETRDALGKVSLSLMKAQNLNNQEVVADSIQTDKIEEMEQ